MTNDACRLLVDPPAAGAWNMAVDEMLLEWAARQQRSCLRFYAWHEPTLSLGYFQDIRQRSQHTASQNCLCVRRLTGGGAILHDVELTYSVVLPARHHLAARRDELYETLHSALIQALADLGVTATRCGRTGRGTSPTPPLEHEQSASSESCGLAHPTPGTNPSPACEARPAPEPFLCFQRRTPSDVLVGDSKIAGSAQRRRRGAVLQHGSVLLGRSSAAPEVPGLAELTGQAVRAEDLIKVWLAKLAGPLAPRWYRETLSAEELQQASLFAQQRYATHASKTT